jgi:predicted secreted protein
MFRDELLEEFRGVYRQAIRLANSLHRLEYLVNTVASENDQLRRRQDRIDAALRAQEDLDRMIDGGE